MKSIIITTVRLFGLTLTLIVLASLATFLARSWRQPAPRHFAKARNSHDSLSPAPQRSRIKEDYGQLPLSFVENRGQLDSRVGYYLQGRDKAVYFTSEGITFTLTGNDQQPTPVESFFRPAAFRPADFIGAPDQERTPQRWVLKLDFIGANPHVKPEGRDQTDAVISYFKGARNQWRAGLKTYSTVLYRDLWPGIDLVYSGTVNRLKYQFVVKPGADPKQIKLAYRGASAVGVNDAGQLEVSTPAGGFHDDRPFAYQETAAGKTEVIAAYSLANDETMRASYGFSVGDYDHSTSLVLDPAVVVYCGLIGGAGDDAGNSIAVDKEGNVYVAGTTDSADDSFPVTAGRALSFRRNLSDIFVAKVNAEGTSLIYTSYLGGRGENVGQVIAVDAGGNTYVTGQTSAVDFPTVNARQARFGGGIDAFVAKLSPTGSALAYSTYLGGFGSDEIHGIAVDDKGYIYVTGSTQGDLSATDGAFRNYYGGGAHDAFVAKLSPKASDSDSPGYVTYLGGGGDDRGFGVAVDPKGAAYVTGQTSSLDFPVAGAVQPALNGAANAFVTKLNPSGSALAYSTFLGGTGSDIGRAIAVDDGGVAYVTGGTTSPDFPTMTPWRASLLGGSDGFVAKLSEDGSKFVYSTYLGGSGDDEGRGIALNSSGNAHVIGRSNSSDFPLINPWQPTYGGGAWDAFVTQLSPAGSSPIYSSYFGGGGDDRGNAIAVDSSDNVYVTGATSSPNFLTVNSFQSAFSGGTDAFVAKIAGEAGSDTLNATAVTCAGTKNWTGPATGGKWETAANWSGGTLPTSSDDVCIPAGVTVQLTSGTHTVNSLGSNGNLIFSAGSLTVVGGFNSDGAVTIGGTGTLTLNSTSTISSTLTITSGTLSGTGGVIVAGLITWSGGMMTGAGTVDANGGININGTVTKTLNAARVLNNNGVTTWTNTGDISIGNNAVFNNLSGATFDAQNNEVISLAGGVATFNNSGTFKKSVGTGTTTFNSGVAFHNTGTAEVLTGTLKLDGGTSSGSFSVPAGTTLEFGAGTHTLSAASSVAGAGNCRFSAGTVNLAGVYDITGSTTVSGATANFTGTVNNIGSPLTVSAGTANFNFSGTLSIATVSLSGGTLSGPSAMNITGLLTWSGGTITGSGMTNANGGMSLSGNNKTLSGGRVLNNSATATWTGTGDISLGSGTTFNNLSGATFDAQNSETISVASGSATFNNSGAFKKSAGTSTTLLYPVFNNNGTVEVQAGRLDLWDGGTHSGTMTGAAGTTFEFRGSHNFTASSSISAANIYVTRGGITVTGTYNVTGSTTADAFSGITLSGPITNLGATLATIYDGDITINSAPATSPSVLNHDSGGTVKFNFGGEITIQTIHFAGGTLICPPTLNISGLFTWIGGTMSGAGVTNANGGMSLSGSGKNLIGRTINNNGTVTWISGDIGGSGGAVFNNPVGSVVNVQGSGGFSASPGTFNNAGTFRLTASATSSISSAVFNNSGTVEVQAGRFSLYGGGTHTGTMTGAAGTTLEFRGSNNFTASSSISAPNVYVTRGGITVAGNYNVTVSTTADAFSSITLGGTLTNLGATLATSYDGSITVNSTPATPPSVLNHDSGGTVNFNFGGAITIPTVALSGGTLTGTTSLNISSLFTWSSGTMSGAGATNILAGATLSFFNGTNTRTINNSGTVFGNSGTLTLGSSSVFNNLSGGDFEARDNLTFSNGASGTPAFINSGAFRRSSSTGTVTFINVPFNNTGAVDVQIGTLKFSGGGYTQTAGMIILSGGALNSTTTLNIQGGSLIGAGAITANVSNSGGIVSPSKANAPTGPTGIISITGNYTQTAAGALNVDLGGTSAGTGFDQLTVSGTATLAGLLNVTTLSGYVPNANDAFKVLSWASRSGSFTTINFINTPQYRSYQANYNQNDLTLVTQAIPVADLSLTKTDAPDPAPVGGNLTYTLKVTNSGPDPATNVSVSDTLPAGVSFVSASSSQGTCSGTILVTCNLGTLNNGTTATVTIIVQPTLVAVAASPITNTASVTATEVDSNTANNLASATTMIIPSADLALTLTDSPDPVFAGDELTYTLVVTNNGPSTATGVTLTDALPSGATFVSASAGCSPSSGTVTCNLGDIASGAGATITIVVRPTGSGTINNSASVSSGVFDPNTANNAAQQGTLVNPKADLSITKTDSPDPVLVGHNLTYTIRVTNQGPSPATAVNVADNLPTVVTFVSASSNQGTCGGTSAINCNLGTLAIGQTVTVTIVVTPTAAAVPAVSNTASVTSDTFDPNTANNSATQATTVNAVTDLALSIADSPDPVLVGDPLTYTIVATNNGPADATGVTVSDHLPSTVAFVSASSTVGSCTQASGTVSCTIGPLANGASATVTIIVTPQAAAAGLLNNTASVSGAETDPDAANNSAPTSTAVNPKTDLRITKNDLPDPVFVGSPLTYEIAAINGGPSPATGVIVSDVLPSTTTFDVASFTVGATGGSCAYNGETHTVTCNIGNLASGQTASVTIVVIPQPAAVPSISNTASVTGNQTDPDLSNNSATAETTVLPKADLSITKTDSPDPVTVFSPLTYTIAVSNSGPSSATGIVVTDQLPASVNYVSASSGCNQGGGTVTCNLGNLASGATATVTVVVTPTTGGTISNTASVTAHEFDPNTANNTAAQSTMVNAAADLAITNTATPDPVITGEQLTYTLSIINNGPGIASSVVVTDNLPASTTFVSCAAAGGVCGGSGNNRTVSFPSLAAGASAIITLVVQVNCSVSNGTAIGNTATVSSATPDTVTENNSASVSTLVSDPPPTVTAPMPVSVTTGAGATVAGAVVSEVMLGTATANDNCGSVTITRNGVPAGNFFPVGTTNVIYTATDSTGNTTTATQTVTVTDNTSPVITRPTDISVEGNILGSCSANVSIVTATATDNCPGVTVAGVRSDGLALNAPYPLGTTLITWTATDTAGNRASCLQQVVVTNPSPVVTITGPATGAVYAVNTPVSFAGSFVDNAGGTHTAIWAFDELSQVAAVNETNKTVAGSYTFTAAGVHLVTLTVADSCGGTGMADSIDGLTALIVIYDPNSGHVTGGGWINSPAGAYMTNPSLTGKANFGFVSKYEPGANVPTGQTEFQFKAGNLNFHSTSYEWLVVAGARAQYKGSGTINGAGNYRFMLTVIDGQVNGGGGVDKFRIKIWDSTNGGIVYDNQMGAGDDATPATALGGGSIVIHR
jgi:uncharacterized repeat protein (TIGR01451 family)